ncbi:MAG: hypothetical protein CMM25_01890 [Rhodospirillaceae bacterium]|nr:hypothetical protein [Rhodospirillaceae bacterium]|tara:strand:+ start:187 stop:612 length:426 start_codon:yes stop_codon:yes gene_type:complete
MEKENHFNNAYDTLVENQLGSNYNSGTPGDNMGIGGKGMSFKPESMSLLDIVQKYEDDKRQKNPNDPIIAYPLDKIPTDLGEMVVRLASLVTLFKQAAGNPIIKENPKAVKTIKKILKKLSHSGGVIMSIKDDIDDLVVEK